MDFYKNKKSFDFKILVIIVSIIAFSLFEARIVGALLILFIALTAYSHYFGFSNKWMPMPMTTSQKEASSNSEQIVSYNYGNEIVKDNTLSGFAEKRELQPSFQKMKEIVKPLREHHKETYKTLVFHIIQLQLYATQLKEEDRFHYQIFHSMRETYYTILELIESVKLQSSTALDEKIEAIEKDFKDYFCVIMDNQLSIKKENQRLRGYSSGPVISLQEPEPFKL